MKPGSSDQQSSVLAIAAVLAICALGPVSAQAAINVPPGATEGDQYFEEVPTGKGGRSLDRGGPGGGASAGAPPVAATSELSASGAEGQTAADLANSNRPPEGNSKRPDVEPATSSTEGESGMGALFPILLGVIALAAIAYGAKRRLTPA